MIDFCRISVWRLLYRNVVFCLSDFGESKINGISFCAEFGYTVSRDIENSNSENLIDFHEIFCTNRTKSWHHRAQKSILYLAIIILRNDRTEHRVSFLIKKNFLNNWFFVIFQIWPKLSNPGRVIAIRRRTNFMYIMKDVSIILSFLVRPIIF